jgi:anti-sigma factor RsiW
VDKDVSRRHPLDDDLHLYVLGRLPATEAEILERHVFQCPTCKDTVASITRLVARLNQAPTARGGFDKRREPRFRTADTGFLRSFAPLLPDRWPVQILDVSKNGLGLAVPTSLPKDSLIQVQVGNTFALGEVRHSTPIDEQRFHVGIRVIHTVGKK